MYGVSGKSLPTSEALSSTNFQSFFGHAALARKVGVYVQSNFDIANSVDNLDQVEIADCRIHEVDRYSGDLV